MSGRNWPRPAAWLTLDRQTAIDPIQPVANLLFMTLDSDIGNVLRSLIEDNGSDDYGCFDTIEPYVNANREIELDGKGILSILDELRERGLLMTYRCSSVKDQYEAANNEPITSKTWFRATSRGISMYESEYSMSA